MKFVKHGEPGVGKVEAEGQEKVIRFMFDQFKSRGHGHYAELFDDTGALIATKSFGVSQTF
jgi:hypothetical protein